MKIILLSIILAFMPGCVWLLAAAVIDKQENTNRTKVQNEHEEHMKELELEERRMEQEKVKPATPVPSTTSSTNPWLDKP